MSTEYGLKCFDGRDCEGEFGEFGICLDKIVATSAVGGNEKLRTTDAANLSLSGIFQSKRGKGTQKHEV